MAVQRSEVASIVQEAASRMNLSLETESEIMESLEKEYINDVSQLQHISFEHWKKMGAPVDFITTLEATIEEAGLSKHGKGQVNRRRSGNIKGISTQRSSGNSRNANRTSSPRNSDKLGKASGKSTTRQRKSASRSTSRDEDSGRSGRSTISMTSTKSSNETRQAALRELKDSLRTQAKQGRAKTQFDNKGKKVYEWGQNDLCVLVYIAWPFEFEFGSDTKFKCTISRDTLLLKAKHKTRNKSLRFTTGELANALHSEWCVVSKGRSTDGVGRSFAIEVALFKKQVGVEWNTALTAKHIGTNHMSPDQIQDELRSYGLDPGSYKTNDELLKALRLARVQNSSFSSMGPSPRQAPARSRSADDVNLFDEPGKPKSPKSRSKNGLRRTRSSSHDRALVGESSMNKFSEGEIVYYTSSDGRKQRAKILKIHLDDDHVPFFDIRLTESGKEKQTTDTHLSRVTDDFFDSERSTRSGSSHIAYESIGKSQPQQASTAPNQVPQKSRFTENQVVYYTNNGQKEKAKILKIHLDDDLVPFYDIRLVDSGKEKQTTDSRLSSLTDDLFKAAAQGFLSEIPGSPVRHLPDRSRSLDEESFLQSSTVAVPSRFTENQVVYYTNNGQKEKAKILKIHLDDDLVPFYDIRLMDSGKEKQTTDSRLSSLTDDLFKAAAQGSLSEIPGPPVRNLPDRSRSMDAASRAVGGLSPGVLRKKTRRHDRRSGGPSKARIQAPGLASTPSEPVKQTSVPQKSRFTENQVVYYTNNGRKEKAKILKIHLDDDLVPFYDIRLVDSGKEKQTTDSRLSSLTDDMFKAAAQGRGRSGSFGSELPGGRSGSAESDLPAPPVRNLPDRSRSMDAASRAVGGLSPGVLRKKTRRHDRRSGGPSKARIQAPGLASTPSEPVKQTSVPQKSRFKENQVVYYTNNGQKEKAKILKIHLDDDLVPFYDIRLVDSGKEKQTTDSRLSSLTDDLFKAAAQGTFSELPCPPIRGQAGSDLPGPARNLPSRSRSLGGGATAPKSPGVLKKGRRDSRKARLERIHERHDTLGGSERNHNSSSSSGWWNI